MKNQYKHLLLLSAALVALLSTASAAERWMTQNASISFFSSTPTEDIQAGNNSVVVVLDSKEASLAFSVPMQAFEFEKSLMQKHFNGKNFLNTKKFPQATFKGEIADTGNLDLSKNGEYEVTVSGTMAIMGVEKEVSQKGRISVSGKTVTLHSEFDLTLGDYEIDFKKGKPAKNIAKTVKVTVNAENLTPEVGA